MIHGPIHLLRWDPAPLVVSHLPRGHWALLWPCETPEGEAAGLVGKAQPLWNQTGLTYLLAERPEMGQSVSCSLDFLICEKGAVE